MTPHKHCEVIKAWADGAEIQAKSTVDGSWINCYSPTFANDVEYRIKPRTVKREGWVNIYRASRDTGTRDVYGVHLTEEIANTFAGDGCVATLKIEWTEEQ